MSFANSPPMLLTTLPDFLRVISVQSSWKACCANSLSHALSPCQEQKHFCSCVLHWYLSTEFWTLTFSVLCFALFFSFCYWLPSWSRDAMEFVGSHCVTTTQSCCLVTWRWVTTEWFTNQVGQASMLLPDVGSPWVTYQPRRANIHDVLQPDIGHPTKKGKQQMMS